MALWTYRYSMTWNITECLWSALWTPLLYTDEIPVYILGQAELLLYFPLQSRWSCKIWHAYMVKSNKLKNQFHVCTERTSLNLRWRQFLTGGCFPLSLKGQFEGFVCSMPELRQIINGCARRCQQRNHRKLTRDLGRTAIQSLVQCIVEMEFREGRFCPAGLCPAGLWKPSSAVVLPPLLSSALVLPGYQKEPSFPELQEELLLFQFRTTISHVKKHLSRVPTSKSPTVSS